jgi:hypothetical protein
MILAPEKFVLPFKVGDKKELPKRFDGRIRLVI